MAQPTLAPLARRMDARLEELVEQMVERLPQRSQYYAAMPVEDLRFAATNLYKLIRSGVEDNGIERLLQGITQIGRNRLAQGGSTDDLQTAIDVAREINLSLVEDIVHSEPDAALPAFVWLDQLSSMALKIFSQFAREALARQAEELSISMVVSERLEQAQVLSEAVEVLFEHLARLGVDRALVSTISGDDPADHHVVSVFERDPAAPAPAAGMALSPARLLAELTPDTTFVSLDMATAEVPAEILDLFAPLGVRMLAVFPLWYRQEARGLLLLGYRQSHQINAQEQRFLGLLARMLRNRILTIRLAERLNEQIEQVIVFRSMVEDLQDIAIIGDLNGGISYVNLAGAQALEINRSQDLVDQSFFRFVAPEERARLGEQVMPTLLGGQPWKGEVTFMSATGRQIPVVSSVVPLRDLEGRLIGIGGIHRDERERLALIESLRRSNADQEHTLDLLRQISTPLVPVIEGILVMPIIGEVDTPRANQILEALLGGIARTGADTIILDITGVPVVDTAVANALILSARAGRLLGAEVLLVGITPEVAQALVGLGADLSELVTRGDLQSGIAYALRRRGYRIARDDVAPVPGD
jgi:PAS domain S-box-containing protein